MRYAISMLAYGPLAVAMSAHPANALDAAMHKAHLDDQNVTHGHIGAGFQDLTSISNGLANDPASGANKAKHTGSSTNVTVDDGHLTDSMNLGDLKRNDGPAIAPA